jgi:hypothetical protein
MDHCVIPPLSGIRSVLVYSWRRCKINVVQDIYIGTRSMSKEGSLLGSLECKAFGIVQPALKTPRHLI